MVNDSFPLRDVQAAYWAGRTAGLMLGNVGAYCYYEYEADGIEPERLSRAWRTLIARHDALRVILSPDGQQHLQAEVPTYEIRVNEFSMCSEAEAHQQLTDVRARLSHRTFSLDEWPLFVVEVTRLPFSKARFHLGMDLFICDAASIRILLRELAQLYVDPSAELPVLTSTFRDYVLAERNLRTDERYEQARRFWLRALKTLPPAPMLPQRAIAEGIHAPRFVRSYRDFDEACWSVVKAHAASNKVTPTAVLLALYADVLARHAAEERFTLNVPLFNRLPLVPGVERLVGDFTSLIPVAVGRDSAPTFIERVRYVQRQLWRHLDHRIASDVFWRERTQGGARYREGLLPYVFTSVIGLDAPTSGLPEEWPLAPLPIEMIGQTPQVMADFVALESDGRLRWALHYVDGLFHQETIDGIIDTFSTGLTALERPDAWQSRTMAVRPRDTARISPVGWIEGRPDARLEQLFLESAERTPNAPAIITASSVMTYRELERRSASLARSIRERDVTVNSIHRVAVVIPKGWEQIAAVLGIHLAGAAYVPIDPQLPQARVDALLEGSGVTTVLTRSDLDRSLEWPARVHRILVDETPPADAHEVVSFALGSPDSLAYVIYTSGSTGVPKGVMISHRAAVNTIVEINRMCGVTESDRVLAISSLSFDLSVYDIFGPLAVGGAVVMPDPGRELIPEHWIALMQSAGVTVWNSVPALLQLLLDRSPGTPLPCLRLAMLSGDWIPLTLPEMFWRWAPQARLLAMGGATEASIWSIYKWIDRVEANWTSVPYGRALPNQSVYVLDEHLDPRPVWVPGELYIGGIGVAVGYADDPERTAASFVVHPSTRERLYRTGDFGRYLPDGEIEFLGRRDSQVKIFGHRIELGEIENVLLRHDRVQQCAVVAVGEERCLTSLVAYVVRTDTVCLNIDELRQFLADRLPAYMVPRDILALERLPLTPNGKVDRRVLALRRPINTERPSCSTIVPRNATEATVAGFWAEVLQINAVGIHDDFFELGGDSLAAARIVSRVNAAFGCSKSMLSIFDQPTIAEFCSDLLTSATPPFQHS